MLIAWRPELIVTSRDLHPALNTGLVAGQCEVTNPRCNMSGRVVAMLALDHQGFGPARMFRIHSSGATSTTLGLRGLAHSSSVGVISISSDGKTRS